MDTHDEWYKSTTAKQIFAIPGFIAGECFDKFSSLTKEQQL